MYALERRLGAFKNIVLKETLFQTLVPHLPNYPLNLFFSFLIYDCLFNMTSP